MKPTPLKRLVARARKDKRFFKLLHDDRTAALRQAAEQGINLSPREKRILTSLLSGRRITLTLSPQDVLKALRPGERFPKFKPLHFDFWDIFCELIGYQRSVKRVSKSRTSTSRQSRASAGSRVSAGSRISARSRRR